MADNNVFITGAAEGALAEALNGLPPWATESTAENIEVLLSKLLKVETDALANAIKCCNQGGKGVSSEEAKKVNDELEKFFKSLKRSNEEQAKKIKQDAREEKARKEKEELDEKIRKTSSAWKEVLGKLTLVGERLFGVQKQYFTTSNDLFKSGVNLLNGNNDTSSSMVSLNQMIVLTGLRLETMQKVVEKYTESVNAIGFNKFAKTVSLTNTKLIALGYSSEEQAELIGTLIESESAYADIRGKTSEQLANDAFRLGKQMTRLSVLTGQSNEKLQESIRSLAKNTDSTVVAAVYGEEAAKRMNVFASSFSDTDIGSMFQKLAASAAPQITKSYQALAMAGQGQLAEEFTRIAAAARDGTITAEEANRQATKLAQSTSSTALQSLQLLADKGVEGAAESLSAITKLRSQGNKTSQATEQQVDAAIAAQASLSRFSTALEETRALAQRAFPLLEKQVDYASAALEKFNTVVHAATDLFKLETRSWIAVGLEVIGIIAGLGGAISILRSSLLVLKDIGSVIASAGRFAAGALRTVGGWIGSAGSIIFNGLKSAGTGLVSALKGIGGKLIGIGTTLGLAAAGGYVVDAGLGKLGVGGKEINEEQDQKNWDKMDALEKAQSGLARTIENVGKFFFLDNLANEAAADRIKNETEYLKSRSSEIAPKKEISIPKTPAPSTINSPSAVPAPTPNADTESADVSDASTAIPTQNSDIAKNSDINSVLGYQTVLLTQLLETSQALVSVNRDILKYSKVQS